MSEARADDDPDPESGEAAAPPDPAGKPVYVSADGARISRTGELIEIVLPDGARHGARLGEVSELVLNGNIALTTPCLHELLRRGIPVSWCTGQGWFLGHAAAADHGNVALRIAQHRAAEDPAAVLGIARAVIVAKIANSRTLLRRNRKLRNPLNAALSGLEEAQRRALAARDLAALNGIEGAAAALYFPAFGELLTPPGDEAALHLAHRTRRPPADPVNALLSYAYGLLVRNCILALTPIGFDVGRGFLHQPRPGRPALALDLMEPLRATLADAAVLRLVNTGAVSGADFETGPEGVRLSAAGRRALIAAYERRLDEGVRHPEGGRMSYRRLIGFEARQLAGFLVGRRALPDFFVRR
ncbi:MAG: CRISPR-associated endonuclease Cas1 [Stellaceae bacterium]